MQCFSGYNGTETYNEKKLNEDLLINYNPIISKLKKQKFSKREIDIEVLVCKELRKYFTGSQKKGYEIEVSVKPDNKNHKNFHYTYEVTIKISWDTQWQNLGINVKTYKGQNICLLDI